jgi:aminoglycoside phosphotransferase (APT) family kinase protein
MDQSLTIYSEAIALQIARLYFGLAAVSAERLIQGVMNHMFKIRSEAEELCVVRIYPPGRQKVVAYEPQLVERLRLAGCCVPEVVGYGHLNGGGSASYFVYRFIQGQTLASRQTQIPRKKLQAIGRSLVDNLYLMATLRLRGFGGLITSDTADDNSAWEFFSRSVARGADNADSSRVLSEDVIYRLRALLDSARREVSAFDGALGWGDLAPSNILIDEDDRLIGLIDFESSFVLDRSLSFGYLRAILPDHPLLKILIDEARTTHFEVSDMRIKLCAALRAARMARFAHRNLPSGHLQRTISSILPGGIAALVELTPGQ